MVTLKSVSDCGVYVTLIEYNDIEGYISQSEIHRKIVKPEKIFKRDKIYACLVMSVDINKRYIDLSYRKIKSDDQTKYETNFTYIEQYYKVLKNAYELSKSSPIMTFDELLDCTFRKLFNRKTLAENVNTKELYNKLLSDSKDNVPTEFADIIVSKTVITPYVITQPFDLTIYNSHGVSILKNILTNELFANLNVDVTCDSSPSYKMVVNDNNLEDGKNKIQQSLQFIRNNIVGFKTSFNVHDSEIKERTFRYNY